MPTATREGVTLHYETDGDGETVAFVSDVGYGAWLWGWQHGAVAGPREALVWDLRGTGRSDAPPGPYDVDALAADFEAVLADAGVQRTHVVGAGLGGMVALRYAREYDRARTLTVFGTAASGDAVDGAALRALHPDDGSGLDDSLDGAVTPAFREARPDLVEQIREWRREEDAVGAALDAQMAAMTGFEAGPLYELSLPALVCHGVDDPVVPASAGESLAEDLPRGRYEPVEGRHLCFVEHSRAVTERLLEQLDEYGDGE
ncbi:MULTISPECIES: alpha/beta fold hydrolase [Salinibaculum]|uniref:alpha/beta fold hydrolase n=1 Tax=Salinibaculum TaxID=2732368 RepID=UPI0030D3F9E4